MAQLTLLQQECRWFKDLSHLWEDRERSVSSSPPFSLPLCLHFKTVESWVSSVRCPPWAVHKLNTLKLGLRARHRFVSSKEWEQPEFSAPGTGVVPSLLAGLKECSLSGDLEKGRKLHAQAVDNGLLSNPYVSSSLISMYSKCRSMAEARKIFDSLLRPDVVCWNCLIQGYTENDQSEVAMQLFEQMESFCAPGSRTYVAALSACASLASKGDGKLEEWLVKGREIYTKAVASRSCNTFVENTLLDMYSRCGRMTEARNVFDNMAVRDVVSWTALLHGYVDNGESLLALELFEEMQADANVVPNARTYVTALTACGTLALERASEKAKWLEKGRGIHSTSRCSNNMFVQTSLVDMYSKCGSMAEARKIFDSMASPDVVAWNAIVQGYVDNHQPEVALELFQSMGCVRTARSYAAALTACAKLVARKDGSVTKWLEKGRNLYSEALSNRCSDAVVGTALLNMFMASGSTAEARDAFEKMAERDTVAWDSLVHGYVNNGESEQALEVMQTMEDSGSKKQDTSSLVTAFTACGNLLRLGAGRSFHAEALRLGLEGSSQVTSSLLQFYGKCGKSMDAAEHIFNSAGTADDIYAWNSLMSGYSQQGDAAKVFEVLEKMTEQGTSPNEVTLTLVLAACGHGGLADKAKEVFDDMVSKHGISPDVRHYTCMVDLLGRSNRLKEAVELAKSMKSKADTVTWTAVLDACRKWRNVELGKVAYAALLETPGGRQDASTYVLMGNLLADAGLWDERAKVLRELEAAGGDGKKLTDNETELRKLTAGSSSSYCLLSEMGNNMYSQANVPAQGNAAPSSGGGYVQQGGHGNHGNVPPPPTGGGGGGGGGGPQPPPYNRPPGGGDGNMQPGSPPYNRPPPPGMSRPPGGNIPPANLSPPGGNMQPGMPGPGGWSPQGGHAPPVRGQTGNYPPPGQGQWNMPQGGYVQPGNFNSPQGAYGPPGNVNAPQPPGNINTPQGGVYGRPGNGNVNTPQGGYGPPGNFNTPQGGYSRPPGNVNAPYGPPGGYGPPGPGAGNVNRPQGGYGPPGGAGNVNRPQGGYGPPGNVYAPRGGGYGPPGSGAGSFNRPQGGYGPPGGGYRPPYDPPHGSTPTGGRTSTLPPPAPPPYDPPHGSTPTGGRTSTLPPPATPPYDPPHGSTPTGGRTSTLPPPAPPPYDPPHGSTPTGGRTSTLSSPATPPYNPPHGSTPTGGRTSTLPPPAPPPPAPEGGGGGGGSTPLPGGDNTTSTLPVPDTLPTSGKVIRPVASARTPPSSRTSTAPEGKITPGVFVDGEGEEKEQTCSELMAVAYALIHSEPGSIIRIAKDCRVCDDCHEFVKKISIIEKRKIICRDDAKLHIYENGNCSCGDYW